MCLKRLMRCPPPTKYLRCFRPLQEYRLLQMVFGFRHIALTCFIYTAKRMHLLLKVTVVWAASGCFRVLKSKHSNVFCGSPAPALQLRPHDGPRRLLRLRQGPGPAAHPGGAQTLERFLFPACAVLKSSHTVCILSYAHSYICKAITMARSLSTNILTTAQIPKTHPRQVTLSPNQG